MSAIFTALGSVGAGVLLGLGIFSLMDIISRWRRRPRYSSRRDSASADADASPPRAR